MRATRKPRRILIVDDRGLSLAFEEAVLQSLGYDVRTARDAAACEAVGRTWRPDIVLADIVPSEGPARVDGDRAVGAARDAGGPGLCRLLKACLGAPQVPVFLFSTFTDQVLARMARACGADGFISKAEGLDHLARSLEELRLPEAP